jgi:16S rRNA (guanine527-N7)-methyltransferase
LTDERAARQLADGLARIGYANPSALAGRLLEYGELLLAENRKTNLVGAKTMREFVPHILDSLAPLATLGLESPIIDVGSGGGLPGLAAALAFPKLSFTLIEPRRKRAAFLDAAVKELGVANASVGRMTVRAALKAGLGQSFRTALARALAKPDQAIRLTMPLVRPGGRMILYTGRQSQASPPEQAALEDEMARLEEARPIDVPYLDAKRHVWILVKRPQG